MKSFPQDIQEFTEWINEIKLQKPDLYDKIVNHFKFKEADRKLCVLLDGYVTERRRESTRMESDSMAKPGSSRDTGTK